MSCSALILAGEPWIIRTVPGPQFDAQGRTAAASLDRRRRTISVDERLCAAQCVEAITQAVNVIVAEADTPRRRRAINPRRWINAN